MYKKGQSAMEYLMTYGWALLVIVIVIAVLLYINPFRAPEQCIFDQAGMYCERPILQVNGTVTGGNLASGVLSARIINGERRTITITGIACARGMMRPVAHLFTGTTQNWANDYIYVDQDGNGGVELAPQEFLELRGFGNGNPFFVQCLSSPARDAANNLDLSDNPDSGAAQYATRFRAGEDFSGRLWIMYRFADEPADAPSKLIGANLVTRAQ